MSDGDGVATTLTCRIKPYIQPFERVLALAEMAALAQVIPQPLPAQVGNTTQPPLPLLVDVVPASTRQSEAKPLDFRVETAVAADTLADKLAYWESVRADHGVITTQALREATVNIVRNGVPIEQIGLLVRSNIGSSLPNRRCLRYGPHGLHEYRGKFFPQLVRSLINIAEVPTGGIVADPMSGSGTTLVEAVLAGCRGIGLDMNPLSVLMTRTKCGVLSVAPEDLARSYQHVRDTLLNEASPGSTAALPYFSTLGPVDREYLARWFSEQVLADLDRVAATVNALPVGPIRDLMRLSLSNIIRSVSWQRVDDLRVRREMRVDVDIDPIKEFLEEVGRSVRTLLAFLHQLRGAALGSFDVAEGDARRATEPWSDYRGKVDAIITSPPYATALPYLDTDRLSLCYLGLLPRDEQRERDHRMIGNREVTERGRLEYWQSFCDNKHALPTSVVTLIEHIDKANTETEVGFRRRNLPSLLAKYFIDMKDVLDSMAHLLRPGAPAYVVVGDNHTIAGGERVDIRTASLLTDIAGMVGLEPAEHIPMEMLVSRDLHKKNASVAETILSFRRPA